MASINDYGGDGQTLNNPPLGGPTGWAAAVAAALDGLDTPISARLTAMLLADLANVGSTAPTTGQALVWNGTSWGPATVAGGGGGTGNMRWDGPWSAPTRTLLSSVLPTGATFTHPVTFEAKPDSKAGTTNAMRFADITHRETTDVVIPITTTVDNQTITVRYLVSSEISYDFFRVLLDGVQYWQWAGIEPDYLTAPITGHGLAAGVHNLTLRYMKDSTGDEGDDTAWVGSYTVGGSILGLPYQIGSVVEYQGATYVLLSGSGSGVPGVSTQWARLGSAVINAGDAARAWAGTMAEYLALSADPTTLYFITEN